MALFLNPQIVTSGLVFAYDSANRKSYQGPPIQNKLTSVTAVGHGSGTGYSFVTGSEYSDIPTIGPTLVQYSNIQNNYSAVSTWCCPNPFSYGNDISVSGSTLYTYAIVYRVESGYTNGNYMYRYEYNGGTYVTESGVHSDSNRVHLGNGWYWAWGTFTTQASTTRLLGLASFYYRYSTAYDKMSVANVLLVQGDYTGLHPRYWPNVNTTRATTAAILDLTNKNTITASSLTYASNGTISFSGSNYLTLPASVGAFGSGDFTINCWWKSSGTQSNYVAIMEQGFTGSPSNGAWAFKITHNTSIINFTYYNGGIVDNLSSFNINDGAWHNYLAVRSGTNLTLYVDGVSRYSLTLPTSYSFGEGSSVFVGYNPRDGTYINGSLPILSTYNRALSATEIRQNFNALRTRYSI